MTSADALRDAFWAAVPSKARRIDEPALWADLADHGLTCGRAAYCYGDRGETLVRSVAFNLHTRFIHLNEDVLAKHGPSPERIDFEALDNAIFIACARALLQVAQAERRPQPEAA